MSMRKKVPIGITFDDIEKVFECFPRRRWKSVISQLICKEDKKKKISYLYVEKKKVRNPFLDNCYFELDNLEPDWICPHDVGDYVTHKKLGGIYYIEYVGALDSRYPGTPYQMVAFGNTYFVIGFNNEGQLLSTNDIGWDLTEDNCGYHMFEKIERPDIKPGEFFYYVEMEHKGLLEQVKDDRPFENYIIDNNIKLKLGDTSHKEEYDRFFKAVENPKEHDGSVN